MTTAPKLNPAFESIMEDRREAQRFNRAAKEREAATRTPMRRVAVPKQPNRYLPHSGAKEAARHVGKVAL